MERSPEQRENVPFLPPEIEEEIRRDAQESGMDPDAAVAAVEALPLQSDEEE